MTTAATQHDATRRILLGRVVGAFGVRGEVKLQSFTDPAGAILRYQPWIVVDAQGREQVIEGARGRETPKGITVQWPGVDDRTAAEALHGREIWVARSALPPPQPGEFYWVDLEGLRVVNTAGVDFGRVSHLFSTGVNDVLVVQGERERMIPFARPDYIVDVDFDAGVVTVDWDADF